MIGPEIVAKNTARVAARTPTLLPATHTNSYALGSREVLLVEPATPYEDELAEWIAWARGLESAGRTLVGILATHHHPDHVGGLDVLARELSLPLLVHRETEARLSTGVRHVDDGDVLVLDGPSPMCLEVLHTPGHAEGHVCLLDREGGTVVVGDMVASEGTILIAPGEGHMVTYLRELERLASLGAKVALPAHGGPIQEPSGLFRHYVAHRLARENKVFSAVASFGELGADLDALVVVAYADTPPAIHPIAKLSLEAHLVKLVEEGRVLSREGRYRSLGGEPPR
jgi:glyoxylase-like metal-dependent hydrolase (beta-lactamase superfamily II)